MKNVYMNEAAPDGAESGGGSLISEAAPVTESAPAQVTETPEAAPVNDGPAVERPEWVLDKYATEDRSIEEAIGEQAKAYVELQKQFGGFEGAPDEYELTMPEGVEADIDTESDDYKKFIEIARTRNMNNETANELFQMFVESQHEQLGGIEANKQEQLALLGDKAKERIGAVVSWASNNLASEDMEVLESMTHTADQIQVLERIIGKTRNSPTPKTHEMNPAPQGFTQADFNAAIGSDKFKTDPAYRAEIRKKAAQLFPS